MTDNMHDKVILEWPFSPPDFLETVIKEEGEGYQLVIDSGKAVATIHAEHFDTHPDIRSELHSRIQKRLQGAQLVKHQRFELEDSRLTRFAADGRKTHFLELKGTLYTTSVFPPDRQVRDAGGNVVVDTKQERIDEISSLGDSLIKFPGDMLLEGLLGIFGAAQNDPDNVLVRLYEIRDALHKRFGNYKTMESQLGIAEPQINRFGKLCCDLPLLEGRHRGRSLGQLRPATKAELKEAYDIAQAMIMGYLQYLDKQSSNQQS